MITDEQRQALREAFTSSELLLVTGPGDATIPGYGSACTMTEISLVLTGKLDDGPHPYISEVIRCWVISVQDAMPDEIRNSAAWREAAVGIAGSAVDDAVKNAVEKRRVAFLLDARSTWDHMLTERSFAATDAAAEITADVGIAAAAAAAAAYTAHVGHVASSAYATSRTVAAAGSSVSYWKRRDPAGTLAALIAITDEN